MRLAKPLSQLILAAVAAVLATPPVQAQTQTQTQTQTARRDEQDAATIAEAPLKDVGMVKDKIPPVLLAARTATYALPSPLTCESISDAVEALDAELAPDLDVPSTQIKTGMSAGELGETLVHGLMPMRAWVRKLSGAEKNAREVQSAIVAGSIRRGYLKGVGLERGCQPPAAPLNVTRPAESPDIRSKKR